MQLSMRNPGDLKPFERNPRKNDEAVKDVARSIKEFGFNQPIVVDQHDRICVGHTRYKAAIQLGLLEVPVLKVEMTEEKFLAYNIADNKTGERATWNTKILEELTADMIGRGMDLAITGMHIEELQNLTNEAFIFDGTEIPENKVEERGGSGSSEPKPDPVSIIGDVWLLGRHRLMCGDSVNFEHLKVLMQNKKADMIFTDPPWNVNYGDTQNGHGWRKEQRTILNDHMNPEDWKKFCDGISRSLFDNSKPGASIYVVMSAQEWPIIHGSLSESGFHWSSTIIWAKDRLVMSRKDYHTQYEPIWYGWNGEGPRLFPMKDRKQSDLWHVDRPTASELHPTTKPIELVERAIKNSSIRGSLVLDLFGGSGSTLIACENTGRTCHSMELDPKYADVIVRRWQEVTGEKAILESKGVSFNQIELNPSSRV